jgi:hypothetical protein
MCFACTVCSVRIIGESDIVQNFLASDDDLVRIAYCRPVLKANKAYS